MAQVKDFDIRSNQSIPLDIDLLEQARRFPPPTWEEVFRDADDEIREAQESILKLGKGDSTCFPPYHLVYIAFRLTPLPKVKVVVVGQDPYHNEGQAMGLSFSVPRGVKIPPSLLNIFKETESCIPGFKMPSHGDLTRWAQQGVLMLNKCWTVIPHKAGSHKNIWMGGTNRAVKALIAHNSKIIWVLWGNEAQKLTKIIGEKGFKLTAAHPSPLSASRGFFGCGHPKLINEQLIKLGEKPVDWNLDD